MPYTESKLCQIDSLSCIGCCGHHFKSKEELELAIKKNTEEFGHFADKVEFMNRSAKLRDCGICRNIIYLENGRIGCPLHPKENEVDFREGHCVTEHLCKAAFEFNLWDKQKQKSFLGFIKKKNLDWYDYSIKMDNDAIIEEFDSLFSSADKSLAP